MRANLSCAALSAARHSGLSQIQFAQHEIDIFVAAAGKVDQHAFAAVEFGGAAQGIGHGMGGFERGNNAFFA